MNAPITPSTHASWRALGTSVHVLVTDPGRLEPARRAVAATLELVDTTYSRFRDSELTRLNARAGETVRLSPLLSLALDHALRAARRTEGRVDPTVGRTLRLIGYDADFSQVAVNHDPLTVRVESVPGWRAVSFDPFSGTVRLPAGVELDLGSTGKALAADLAAAAALSASGDGGVLVSLGGDIATAGRSPAGGWRVLLAEDSEIPADADGDVVAISGGALATSSTLVRQWHRGGIRLHHLIDPHTGLPTTGPWRTASVVAATCVEANTASTAAVVLGGRGPGWLTAQHLPARLVAADGSVVRIGGWPNPAEAAA